MTLPEAIETIVKKLKDGEAPVLFLKGELGAGKTHFVNQLAQHLDISRRLPSPTFTFLQEYPCNWQGKRKLVHCDFYRIEPEKADKTIEQIGFWDYLDERNIICIEWPEQAGTVIDDIPHMTLQITLLPDGNRNYELS